MPRFPYPVGHDVPLFLAPMAGVSESPFRRLCRAWGADVVVISVRGVGPSNTPQEAVTFRAATGYLEAASRLGDATTTLTLGAGMTCKCHARAGPSRNGGQGRNRRERVSC